MKRTDPLRCIAFAASVVSLLTALPLISCGSKQEGLGKGLEVKLSESGRAIAGYNEPREWKNNIGVRAAAKNRLLMISVKNQSETIIFVEPEAFRLILPDRNFYEFQAGRDNLSGFVPRELQPGESELFTVGISQQAGDLLQYRLVFNSPQTGTILGVAIEAIGA